MCSAFQKVRLRSAQKRAPFKTYRTWRRETSQLRTIFLLINLLHCFDHFQNILKRRIYRQIVTHDIALWRNSHCLQKWNEADKTLSQHEVFFAHKSHFEQVCLKGLDFCSLYCPLCFDYGVYSKVMINLRLTKTIYEYNRTFERYVAAILPLLCESFNPTSFKTQVPEQRFPTWGTCTLSGTFVYLKRYI